VDLFLRTCRIPMAAAMFIAAVSHICERCNGNTKGKLIRWNLSFALSTVQCNNRTTEQQKYDDQLMLSHNSCRFKPFKSSAVTICNTRFNLQIFCAHSTEFISVCVCKGISEQTETLALYKLKWLVFMSVRKITIVDA